MALEPQEKGTSVRGVPSPPICDIQLIKRTQQDETEALSEWVRRYQDRLVGVLTPNAPIAVGFSLRCFFKVSNLADAVCQRNAKIYSKCLCVDFISSVR